MPKKTKKQKLISEYRRKLQEISSNTSFVKEHQSPIVHVNSQPIQKTPHATTYTFSKPVESHHATTIEIDTSMFSLIKKDLIFTLLLVFGVLILEFTIWRFFG